MRAGDLCHHLLGQVGPCIQRVPEELDPDPSQHHRLRRVEPARPLQASGMSLQLCRMQPQAMGHRDSQERGSCKPSNAYSCGRDSPFRASIVSHSSARAAGSQHEGSDLQLHKDCRPRGREEPVWLPPQREPRPTAFACPLQVLL